MASTQHAPTPAGQPEIWPSLPLVEWADTCATLHMWTQVVGKIRMELAPLVNHWWNVPLYVSPRGLTTCAIPYGAGSFEMRFDFLEHALRIESCDGGSRSVALRPKTVAQFYRETMAALVDLGIELKIWTTPVEVPEPIPFERDEVHGSYDAERAQRFWRVLLQADRVLTRFRSGFAGKVSPVHFFWGSFDLAVTRFSGRPAPPHPGAPNVADSVTREAYSHEVSSAGFWPGGFGFDAIFYAYAYPGPEGFDRYPVQPKETFFSKELGEFVLPYEAVRNSDDPDEALLAFLQSTYEAAAELAQWDRAALERAPAG